MQVGAQLIRQVGLRVGQRLGATVLDRLAALSPAIAELLGKVPARPAAGADAPTQGSPASTSEREATGGPPRDALLHTLREGEAWQQRAAAAAQLVDAPGEQADAELAAALGDDSVEVAVAAASALGRRGGMHARLALLEVLRNPAAFYHPLVRAAAVTALGELLEPDAVEPLLDAVGDQDAEVSVAAIAALVTARAPAGADRLLLLLEEVSGFYLPTTRVAAARALASLPAVDRERLARLREHERDAQVRQLLDRVPSGLSVA